MGQETLRNMIGALTICRCYRWLDIVRLIWMDLVKPSMRALQKIAKAIALHDESETAESQHTR